MAKNNNKPIMVVGLIVVLIIGVYVVAPETFSGLTQSVTPTGGVVAPSSSSSDVGMQDYEGSVTVNLVHRDALDASESRTEGTNLNTSYYKKVNGVYKAIGSGSGNTVFVDQTLNVMYMGVSAPSGQAYFVAPASTADSVGFVPPSWTIKFAYTLVLESDQPNHCPGLTVHKYSSICDGLAIYVSPNLIKVNVGPKFPCPCPSNLIPV